MTFLSGPLPWVLIFFYGLFFLLKKFGRQVWKPFLVFVFTVSIGDLFAYRVLKPAFGRKRPCIEFSDVRTISKCGGTYGFPSNHATNGAIDLVLFCLFIRKRFWSFLLGAFVAAIGISRVYLGAHYPLDVLAGFLLGTVIAYLMYVGSSRVFKTQSH